MRRLDKKTVVLDESSTTVAQRSKRIAARRQFRKPAVLRQGLPELRAAQISRRNRVSHAIAKSDIGVVVQVSTCFISDCVQALNRQFRDRRALDSRCLQETLPTNRGCFLRRSYRVVRPLADFLRYAAGLPYCSSTPASQGRHRMPSWAAKISASIPAARAKSSGSVALVPFSVLYHALEHVRDALPGRI